MAEETTPLLSGKRTREPNGESRRVSFNQEHVDTNEIDSSTSSVNANPEDNDDQDSEGSSEGSESEQTEYTTQQWVTLAVLLIATLTSSFAVCLFPPFFPKIAEEKGCTATIYGFIIGTNCLTSFFVTPFIGEHLRWIGPRFALIAGMSMGGVCCFLSGFLEFFQPGWRFVVVAVAIRIVHATGNAMVITATFTYSAMEFANDVGKVFSWTRTAMNVAQMMGPAVGGVIYQAGGFYLPFVVMGLSQVVMSVVSIPFLPDCHVPPKRSNRKSKDVTVWNMLLTPSIWISFLTFVVATACNGFLSLNLEPKVLRRFELNHACVGLLFGLKDGANSIASPFWGLACDRSQSGTVKHYIVLSSLLVAISFFLLGASFTLGEGIELSIPLVVIALSLNGAGIGGEQVAGVMDALHGAVNAGYPADPSMHGIIAGLWSSLSGLGRFVSRGGSGILVDNIGFNKTALVALVLQLMVASVAFGHMFFYDIIFKRFGRRSWDDLTIIEEGSHDEVVFTESNTPSESVVGRSVHVEIPSSRRRSTSRRHHQSAAVRVSSVPCRDRTHRQQYSRSMEFAKSVFGSDTYF